MNFQYNLKTQIPKFLLAGTLALTTLTACKKNLLDTAPETSISDAAAFSTPAKILAQVNNLYAQLEKEAFYGGRYPITNEQRGEEFSQNDANSATGALAWGQNVSPSTDLVNNLWSQAYKTINSANIIIDGITKTNVITAEVAQQYTAEAKFVRALSYFSLVQTYAKPYALDKASLGVPLRFAAETGQGNNDLARSSVAEVYTQIVKDLNEAEAGLPNAYTTALLNTTRAHKATAIALKTRVYLVQNDYTSVATEAAKIVPATAPYQFVSGTLMHKLEASIATVFNGSYTGAEALFFLPFSNTTTETPGSQSSLAYTYLGQPIVQLNTAAIVANPVFSTASDARSGLITVNATGQKLLKKFSIITAPYRDYIPVIRYAEVLLNYAEAAAENNDVAKATALLSAVRNRSDAAYSFPAASVDTKAALINTILTERRIELLGEGQRVSDLQRRLQTLPAKTGPAGSAPAVPTTAANYIWPIPASELSANKLAVQN
jgi:hypothetical protein